MHKRLFHFRVSLFFILVCIFAPKTTSAQDVSDLLIRLEAYPDVIVINGKIAVMDDQLTSIEALAIRNHRILSLGTTKEIRELAGPKTQVIDVKGRTVLPGIIDSHTHFDAQITWDPDGCTLTRTWSYNGAHWELWFYHCALQT